MNRTLKILLSIPRTVYFNLRYLPLRCALKLPVWIAPNVRIKCMHRGAIDLGQCSPGCIRIGFHEADAVDTYSSRTIIDIHPEGSISFTADAHIGHGAILCVKPGGRLQLGHNFAISGTTSIVCARSINVADNVQFSWDSLVMDSDAHVIMDATGSEMPNVAAVSIGNDVWIAAGTTILKGSVVPDGCVVAARSIVNKVFTNPHTLIGGSPAREIKTIGGWHL